MRYRSGCGQGKRRRDGGGGSAAAGAQQWHGKSQGTGREVLILSFALNLNCWRSVDAMTALSGGERLASPAQGLAVFVLVPVVRTVQIPLAGRTE